MKSMRRFAITSALVAALAGGCTSTHWIRRPATAAELETWMPRQRDRVTLLHAGSEGETAPLVEVSKLRGYEVKNRGRGALEGLGLGILAGALAGFAVGASFGSDGPCTNDDGGCVMFSASDKGFALGLIGALVGSAVGPLIGFAAGHTNRYVFSDAAARP